MATFLQRVCWTTPWNVFKIPEAKNISPKPGHWLPCKEWLGGWGWMSRSTRWRPTLNFSDAFFFFFRREMIPHMLIQLGSPSTEIVCHQASIQIQPPVACSSPSPSQDWHPEGTEDVPPGGFAKGCWGESLEIGSDDLGLSPHTYTYWLCFFGKIM